MNDFNDCIRDAILSDIRATGLYYTWKTRVKKRKIDRALVNEEWLNKFPNSVAQFMSHATSGHTTILLSMGIHGNQFAKPFKILNYGLLYQVLKMWLNWDGI